MRQGSDVDVVLTVLDAVERRDRERLDRLYHPEIEFRWPPSLPYGGTFRGQDEVAEMASRFGAIWIPLQPTIECRRMDPQVVATGEGGRVVVNYLWKGVDRQGRRFQTETLADYQVREGRLARAQMFHFDLAGPRVLPRRRRRDGRLRWRTARPRNGARMTAMIVNLHGRMLHGSAARVDASIDGLGSDADRLRPGETRPPMRFADPSPRHQGCAGASVGSLRPQAACRRAFGR